MHFANPSSAKSKLRLNGRTLPNAESVVQVDITVEPFANMGDIPHNGIEATDLIGEWMENYPLLGPMVLPLKSILKKHNLGKSYEGTSRSMQADSAPIA